MAQVLPRCCTHIQLRGFSETYRVALLTHIAACQDIETLDASLCEAVPSWQWDLLREADLRCLRVANFWSSFASWSQGLAGSAAVLQLLASSRYLERIKLNDCGAIPAEAWGVLQCSDWPYLREADFSECFVNGTPGCSQAGMVIKLLTRCKHLERINLALCDGISVEDFELLGAASWLELAHASFFKCFAEEDRVPAQRAVLQLLSRCPKLRQLDMRRCKIQEIDLLELPTGCWLALNEFQSDNPFAKHLERLRRPSPRDAFLAVADPTNLTAEDFVSKKPERKARRKVKAKPKALADENTTADTPQDEAARGSAEGQEVEQPVEAGELQEVPQSSERKQPKKRSIASSRGPWRVREGRPHPRDALADHRTVLNHARSKANFFAVLHT